MRLETFISYVETIQLILGVTDKIFYWPFQGGTSFVDLLCFFCLVFVMLLCASVYLYLVVTCWEKGDLLAPVCGV